MLFTSPVYGLTLSTGLQRSGPQAWHRSLQEIQQHIYPWQSNFITKKCLLHILPNFNQICFIWTAEQSFWGGFPDINPWQPVQTVIWYFKDLPRNLKDYLDQNALPEQHNLLFLFLMRLAQWKVVATQHKDSNFKSTFCVEFPCT